MNALTVLIAEDEESLRDILSQWLTAVGHNVTTVPSGNAALRLLKTQRFDLIIADILMPEGDGLEIMMEVRRSASSARVLAISGGGPYITGEECLKLAQKMGAQGLLMKPFNEQQLVQAITAAMGSSTGAAPA